MTEAEGDLLHDIKNQYWHDFSELVSSTLLLAPPHLRDSLEEMLQESSSVYGRNHVHDYEKNRPHPYSLTRGPCRICAEHFASSLHKKHETSIL